MWIIKKKKSATVKKGQGIVTYPASNLRDFSHALCVAFVFLWNLSFHFTSQKIKLKLKIKKLLVLSFSLEEWLYHLSFSMLVAFWVLMLLGKMSLYLDGCYTRPISTSPSYLNSTTISKYWSKIFRCLLIHYPFRMSEKFSLVCMSMSR